MSAVFAGASTGGGVVPGEEDTTLPAVVALWDMVVAFDVARFMRMLGETVWTCVRVCLGWGGIGDATVGRG